MYALQKLEIDIYAPINFNIAHIRWLTTFSKFTSSYFK